MVLGQTAFDSAYREISLLALPFDEELYDLDGVHLVLPDGLQLLQAIHVIPSAPIPQHRPVDLLSWSAIDSISQQLAGGQLHTMSNSSAVLHAHIQGQMKRLRAVGTVAEAQRGE